MSKPRRMYKKPLESKPLVQVFLAICYYGEKGTTFGKILSQTGLNRQTIYQYLEQLEKTKFNYPETVKLHITKEGVQNYTVTLSEQAAIICNRLRPDEQLGGRQGSYRFIANPIPIILINILDDTKNQPFESGSEPDKQEKFLKQLNGPCKDFLKFIAHQMGWRNEAFFQYLQKNENLGANKPTKKGETRRMTLLHPKRDFLTLGRRFLQYLLENKYKYQSKIKTIDEYLAEYFQCTDTTLMEDKKGSILVTTRKTTH